MFVFLRSCLADLALLNISRTVTTAAICVHVLLSLLCLHHITIRRALANLTVNVVCRCCSRLLKVVLYICTSVFFAGGVYAVATSATFWDVCADLGTLVGPLQTAMADGQAIFVTFAGLTFAGVCAMLHEVWHCLSTLEQAATPQPKLQRVQLIPQSDFRCGIALHLKSEYGNSCILCTYD